MPVSTTAIAIGVGVLLLLIVVAYYYYASTKTASSSSTPPVQTTPPASTAAAQSPTTTYTMAANTWYTNGPYMPASGCPGNVGTNGWCALPEAQAEALCSASPDCAGYGNAGPGWVFGSNYQLYAANPSTIAQSGAVMYNKA